MHLNKYAYKYAYLLAKDRQIPYNKAMRKVAFIGHGKIDKTEVFL